MKTWLITNYGGPSSSVWDIINNLSRKIKPAAGSRREKFVFHSAITGAIQRLKRLSRVNYIAKVELDTCLLSRSTLKNLGRLLLASEYDLWVWEMTITGLDFKNPIGIDTFNCFKKVCIIERNMNESDPAPKESHTKFSNKNWTVLEMSQNQLFMQCQHQSRKHGTLPQD